MFALSASMPSPTLKFAQRTTDNKKRYPKRLKKTGFFSRFFKETDLSALKKRQERTHPIFQIMETKMQIIWRIPLKVLIFLRFCSIIILKQYMEVTLMKYVCDVCGWEYDEELGYPEGGIAPGTKWEDVPEDFECPLCSVSKDQFSEA